MNTPTRCKFLFDIHIRCVRQEIPKAPIPAKQEMILCHFVSFHFVIHQAVVRQSSGSHQAVVRQSSGSRQAVVRQSSGSHQAVVRQLVNLSLTGSHRAVIKQTSNCPKSVLHFLDFQPISQFHTFFTFCRH